MRHPAHAMWRWLQQRYPGITQPQATKLLQERRRQDWSRYLHEGAPSPSADRLLRWATALGIEIAVTGQGWVIRETRETNMLPSLDEVIAL